MGYLLGVDLGTSSVKTLLMSEDGTRNAVAGRSYDISIPKPGYAEQDPHIWYEKTVETIRECMEKLCVRREEIRGISFSGQMHGMVPVDRAGNVLRPAIIWPDIRTKDCISEIYEKAGEKFIEEQVQNRISTGFLIASLYWVNKYEKEIYDRIYKVMLPKDYIKFRLSGEIVTDYSDAAGSLAFDNVRLCWSKPLLEKLGLREEIFPVCRSSSYIIGNICEQAAMETGLSEETKVVNGGSDQCMQGIGNGIIAEGVFASNIGTGGQISTTTSVPVYDKLLRTNLFAHVIEGRWNMMGAALSSGASLKWLKENIISIAGFEEMNEKTAKIRPGAGGLIFLPYLSGERTPHHDPDARGVFWGLTLKHDKYDLCRAVMEGVVYSLKDCMAVVEETGIHCDRIIASGGGANSGVWMQIQADVLNREIFKSTTKEQACLGAAITAGTGIGIYRDFEEACGSLVKMEKDSYLPIRENVERYRELYEIFREIYQNNKQLFARRKSEPEERRRQI